VSTVLLFKSLVLSLYLAWCCYSDYLFVLQFVFFSPFVILLCESEFDHPSL